jgi:hypothetical protein
LGAEWTPEVAASWTAVYGLIASTMKDGAREFIAEQKQKKQAVASSSPSPLVLCTVVVAIIALFWAVTNKTRQ